MTALQKPSYLAFDPASRRLSLDTHEPAFVQNPFEAYAWLHSASPAFFWEQYGFWCFGGYDEVNRLLRDRRFGRQRPQEFTLQPGERSHLASFDALEAHSLLELEPPAHTRLRTLVNRAFVSRQVERLRPRIEALANELIDSFPESGAFDLLPAYASPLPITIIAEMLGVPVEMGPQLLEWSHRIVTMYVLGPSREDQIAANAASRQFADFLRDHVAERRKRPGDDLISLLIAAQDGDRKLTDDELISSVVLLLNAGHEATVHQTGNAVLTILSRGGDPRRFFATPEVNEATVEECLRYEAPLHMFTRYAYDEVELGDGIRLQPGDQIGLLLGMANRDPRALAEPDRFDPARTDQKNVSFGAGIHFCIGAPLARLELQVSLKVLFGRLPGLALAEPPRFKDIYHFHGLEKLMVRTAA